MSFWCDHSVKIIFVIYYDFVIDIESTAIET